MWEADAYTQLTESSVLNGASGDVGRQALVLHEVRAKRIPRDRHPRHSRVPDSALCAVTRTACSRNRHHGADTTCDTRQHIKLLQDAVSAIQICSKPVIAAVHGLCLGGGIDIIAATDIRFAAEGSVFSIKVSWRGSRQDRVPLTLQHARLQEVDVGLAADVGSLQRLPKMTGSGSLLYELALTARNFGPEEAQKLGLVSKIVSGGRDGVLKAALETAKVIACEGHGRRIPRPS